MNNDFQKALLKQILDTKWFHVIDLPGGVSTPGISDIRAEPAKYGLDQTNSMKDWRVLDVGALDGFWSFYAEDSGAAEVVAIDVDDYRAYDWSFEGPPTGLADAAQKYARYWLLHTYRNSSIRRRTMTVYDVDCEAIGAFDLIIFYGVLYHLRHPLLAFDRLRRVCRGTVIVETHVCNARRRSPASLFYLDDVMDGPTNWTGPSEAAVVHWMRSAGFTTIFAETEAAQVRADRQRFIGCVDEAAARRFRSLTNFAECGPDYFQACRKAVKAELQQSPL